MKLIKKVKIKNCNSGGFTMVELLIAFSLFIVSLSILTTIFLISNRTQRNISELVLVNDNTYLALEQMARDIRDGRDFDLTCGSDCFQFKNRNGQDILYQYSSVDSSIKITNISSGFSSESLTASNVNVVSFLVTPNNCIVDPGNEAATAPVRLTLSLEIRPKNAPNSEGFVNYIQTTVANRNLATCVI